LLEIFKRNVKLYWALTFTEDILIWASEKFWQPSYNEFKRMILNIKLFLLTSSQQISKNHCEKTPGNPKQIFSPCFRESSELSDGTIQ
jgi:hypothetical protein